MIRSSLLTCTISLLFLAACASAAPDPSTARSYASSPLMELSSWQPPPGQRCSPGSTDSLPTFAAVFDSAALVRIASSVTAPGALLISVSTDSAGIPSQLRRIETTLPLEDAEMLDDSLRVHFQGGARFAARVRIDLTPGTEPRFRVGPQQWCAPVFLNRREIQGYFEAANQRTERGGRVVLWTFVNEDGSVRRSHVVEGSDNPFLDAVSVGIATRMQFLPAMIDRQPVPTWIQVPFSLRMN